jgi:prolyl-tRNA synthetase
MVHGDNKGLVLPPRVAPFQYVIIPLFFKGKDTETLTKSCKDLHLSLKKAGFRGHIDDSTGHNPGFKYNHWELRGNNNTIKRQFFIFPFLYFSIFLFLISLFFFFFSLPINSHLFALRAGVPVRIEFGPRDLESGTAVFCRRDTGEKETVQLSELVARFAKLVDEIHHSMFNKAKKMRDECISTVTEWAGFMPALESRKLILAPWCEKPACEEEVKKQSGSKKEKVIINGEEFESLTGAAKTLCIPFEQPELKEGTKCFACQDKAKVWCYWGRSY